MLEVKNLHSYYDKSHILQGVDLSLKQGEIVSLLGRNGVGRSTTIKSIMGQVNCNGTIKFKEKEILGLESFKISRLGIGYVPENREIFPSLTVKQNLLLGLKSKLPDASRWTIDDMYEIFPRLKERENAPAGVLSGGEQQMLSLCRTLMGDPDLVLVDEPTEGLAPKIIEQVSNLFEEMKKRNISILLVEQKLTIALKISQRVYVMGRGKIVYSGTPNELRENEAIRKEWLEV